MRGGGGEGRGGGDARGRAGGDGGERDGDMGERDGGRDGGWEPIEPNLKHVNANMFVFRLD